MAAIIVAVFVGVALLAALRVAGWRGLATVIVAVLVGVALLAAFRLAGRAQFEKDLELIIVAVWVGIALLTAWTARSKDRSTFGWLLFGLVTGPIALIASLMVGSPMDDPGPFRRPMPKPDLTDEAFERWLMKNGFAEQELKPDRLTELHEWFVKRETRRARARG